MKTQKERYLPPQSEALELRLEGVIAQSHEFHSPFTDHVNW